MPGAPWWEDFHPDADTGTGTATRTPGPPAPPAPDPAPRVVHTPRLVRTPRPAGARPGPRGLRALQVTALVLAVVLLAMLGLLATRTLAAPADRAATTPTAPRDPVARASAPPSPSGGTAAADAEATAELEALRRSGLATHAPRGQWVAQLSAKSVGTTDPVQTASNGSSTFYPADILAQSREIASGAAGGDVFVLKTTDFGEGLLDARGNPYWVTLAAGPFADVEDVRTWCASMFADVPAEVRGNVCLPKQLTPRG